MAPLPADFPRELRLLQFDQLDSTNAEAMRRASAGEAGPLWIVAERQSEGRGRSGRRWWSVAGNLHASLLIRLSPRTVTPYQLSLVAGVAVFDAISDAIRPSSVRGLRLNWPNDVLIGTEKTGGILIESTAVPEGLAAVVGIGLNVAGHPEGLERAATHLGAHGTAPEPAILVAYLARTMAHWLGVWAEGRGFGRIREAWLQRSGPIGEPLSVTTGKEAVQGAFNGIDEEGALLLRDDRGRELRFSFGDVALAG
jgi:BirA family biotin operon repressor/biotin-[acetyl-CoA-carboxylase] ligase